MPTKKTLIQEFITYDDIVNRKIFFIFNEMMNLDIVKLFCEYTKNTGTKFKCENCDGYFYVIKKVESGT